MASKQQHRPNTTSSQKTMAAASRKIHSHLAPVLLLLVVLCLDRTQAAFLGGGGSYNHHHGSAIEKLTTTTASSIRNNLATTTSLQASSGENNKKDKPPLSPFRKSRLPGLRQKQLQLLQKHKDKKVATATSTKPAINHLYDKELLLSHLPQEATVDDDELQTMMKETQTLYQKWSSEESFTMDIKEQLLNLMQDMVYLSQDIFYIEDNTETPVVDTKMNQESILEVGQRLNFALVAYMRKVHKGKPLVKEQQKMEALARDYQHLLQQDLTEKHGKEQALAMIRDRFSFDSFQKRLSHMQKKFLCASLASFQSHLKQAQEEFQASSGSSNKELERTLSQLVKKSRSSTEEIINRIVGKGFDFEFGSDIVQPAGRLQASATLGADHTPERKVFMDKDGGTGLPNEPSSSSSSPAAPSSAKAKSLISKAYRRMKPSSQNGLAAAIASSERKGTNAASSMANYDPYDGLNLRDMLYDIIHENTNKKMGTDRAIASESTGTKSVKPLPLNSIAKKARNKIGGGGSNRSAQIRQKNAASSVYANKRGKQQPAQHQDGPEESGKSVIAKAGKTSGGLSNAADDLYSKNSSSSRDDTQRGRVVSREVVSAPSRRPWPNKAASKPRDVTAESGFDVAEIGSKDNVISKLNIEAKTNPNPYYKDSPATAEKGALLTPPPPRKEAPPVTPPPAPKQSVDIKAAVAKMYNPRQSFSDDGPPPEAIKTEDTSLYDQYVPQQEPPSTPEQNTEYDQHFPQQGAPGAGQELRQEPPRVTVSAESEPPPFTPQDPPTAPRVSVSAESEPPPFTPKDPMPLTSPTVSVNAENEPPPFVPKDVPQSTSFSKPKVTVNSASENPFDNRKSVKAKKASKKKRDFVFPDMSTTNSLDVGTKIVGEVDPFAVSGGSSYSDTVGTPYQPVVGAKQIVAPVVGAKGNVAPVVGGKPKEKKDPAAKFRSRFATPAPAPAAAAAEPGTDEKISSGPAKRNDKFTSMRSMFMSKSMFEDKTDKDNDKKGRISDLGISSAGPSSSSSAPPNAGRITSTKPWTPSDAKTEDPFAAAGWVPDEASSQPTPSAQDNAQNPSNPLQVSEPVAGGFFPQTDDSWSTAPPGSGRITSIKPWGAQDSNEPDSPPPTDFYRAEDSGTVPQDRTLQQEMFQQQAEASASMDGPGATNVQSVVPPVSSTSDNVAEGGFFPQTDDSWSTAPPGSGRIASIKPYGSEGNSPPSPAQNQATHNVEAASPQVGGQPFESGVGGQASRGGFTPSADDDSWSTAPPGAGRITSVKPYASENSAPSVEEFASPPPPPTASTKAAYQGGSGGGAVVQPKMDNAPPAGDGSFVPQTDESWSKAPRGAGRIQSIQPWTPGGGPPPEAAQAFASSPIGAPRSRPVEAGSTLPQQDALKSSPTLYPENSGAVLQPEQRSATGAHSGRPSFGDDSLGLQNKPIGSDMILEPSDVQQSGHFIMPEDDSQNPEFDGSRQNQYSATNLQSQNMNFPQSEQPVQAQASQLSHSESGFMQPDAEVYGEYAPMGNFAGFDEASVKDQFGESTQYPRNDGAPERDLYNQARNAPSRDGQPVRHAQPPGFVGQNANYYGGGNATSFTGYADIPPSSFINNNPSVGQERPGGALPSSSRVDAPQQRNASFGNYNAPPSDPIRRDPGSYPPRNASYDNYDAPVAGFVRGDSRGVGRIDDIRPEPSQMPSSRDLGAQNIRSVQSPNDRVHSSRGVGRVENIRPERPARSSPTRLKNPAAAFRSRATHEKPSSSRSSEHAKPLQPINGGDEVSSVAQAALRAITKRPGSEKDSESMRVPRQEESFQGNHAGYTSDSEAPQRRDFNGTFGSDSFSQQRITDVPREASRPSKGSKFSNAATGGAGFNPVFSSKFDDDVEQALLDASSSRDKAGFAPERFDANSELPFRGPSSTSLRKEEPMDPAPNKPLAFNSETTAPPAFGLGQQNSTFLNGPTENNENSLSQAQTQAGDLEQRQNMSTFFSHYDNGNAFPQEPSSGTSPTKGDNSQDSAMPPQVWGQSPAFFTAGVPFVGSFGQEGNPVANEPLAMEQFQEMGQQTNGFVNNTGMGDSSAPFGQGDLQDQFSDSQYNAAPFSPMSEPTTISGSVTNEYPSQPGEQPVEKFEASPPTVWSVTTNTTFGGGQNGMTDSIPNPYMPSSPTGSTNDFYRNQNPPASNGEYTAATPTNQENQVPTIKNPNLAAASSASSFAQSLSAMTSQSAGVPDAYIEAINKSIKQKQQEPVATTAAVDGLESYLNQNSPRSVTHEPNNGWFGGNYTARP